MKFTDLRVGQSAERTREVTDALVRAYAELTGDENPVHLDEVFAARTQFKGRIAHGMLAGGFVSAVIGMDLPGASTVWLSQTLRFTKPIRIGDRITTRVEVLELLPERRRARLRTTCSNAAGELVLEGEALVQMMEMES